MTLEFAMQHADMGSCLVTFDFHDYHLVFVDDGVERERTSRIIGTRQRVCTWYHFAQGAFLHF